MRSRATGGKAWRRFFGVVLALFVLVSAVLGAVVVLSSNTAGREDIVGQAVRLLVTLLIPAAVMIVYWFIVQRQVRTAKLDLETRLDSGQDLIARVSHQLRDQLTVIYGFSEALLDSDMSDQTEVRDVVTIINAEAVDLSRVVDDLVSAAEMEAGEFNVSFSKFDPAVEVERAVLPFTRRGHEISVDCWSGTALSDPIRFRQVVRTLLSNATEHGGPTVGFVGELSNGSFLCTVVDDGDGMGSDLEGQFFALPTDDSRMPSQADGTGLGLTVSRAIAYQLGGHLTYERSSDLTMVTMVLPTAEWPEMPSATGAPDDAEGFEEKADGTRATEEDVTQPEPDLVEEDDGTRSAPETNNHRPDADWLISFDDDEDHRPNAVNKEPADHPLAEEADAVVEAPASS